MSLRPDGLREYTGIYLRGLAMGACDIIPGVSGGTIALITGIYERLVGAIGSIDPAMVKHLVKGDFRSLRADIEKIDIPFLVVLLAGIGTAFLLMSGVILSLLTNHAVETYSFFLGLIIASAVAIFLEIRSPNAATVAFLAVGAVAGYLLGGLGHLDLGHSLPVLFFTGMAALCAMILPGISGAYITLVLNQYEFMLAALRSFMLPEILAYIAGGVAGLLLFTKALKYLLAAHHAAMLALLTGLMLGSSRMLWERGAAAGDMLAGGWLFFIAGLVVIGAFEYAKRRYGAGTA
ncbi:MAG: putative rane protein [Euryarchaeota archaeon]|jgi:putative membrane protein|nr:putative rane protein [Euryarchaeota archaeon]MDN5339015.1 putative rane protein [Euryarchaeota archaeon]